MAERPDEINERGGRTGQSDPDDTEELRRRVGSEDEVEAARAEIERTRAEMTETVDALQERLDPQRLKEQAKVQARDTARSTGSDIVGTIRRNPVPAAIAGGLLGLLLLRWSRRRRTDTIVIDLRRRG